jgi:phage terminase large subunit
MPESEIIIEDSGKFKVLYDLPPDINVVVCIGGRGGRKTYEVSKFIAKSAAIDRKRCVILRDEKETIRESILNDVLNRYDAANEYGHLDHVCERMDTGIKDRKTGDMLVFTKGFRASSNQKKANLKGVSEIDIAVVEEAEDIREEDKFNTFS